METERLLLRSFVLNDAVDLHREIYSDPEVVRYYSGRGVLSLDATRQLLAGHLDAWREDQLGRHAVVLEATGELLGQVHLSCYVNWFARWRGEPESPFNQLEVELAFAFGRRFWGRGFAHEACIPMIDYAFRDLRLRRLVGGAHAENTRSLALQRRLGFRIEPATDGGLVTILDNDRLTRTPE